MSDDGHDYQEPSENVRPRSNSVAIDPEAREEYLRAELAGLEQVTAAIDNVNSSLVKARANIKTVQATVDSANQLLDLWIRILSQTEHTQRLILNRNWKGISNDLEEMERDEIRRQEEKRRRKEEEEARRAERERQMAREAAAREAAERKAAARGRRTPGLSRRGASSSASGTGDVSRTSTTSTRSTRGGIGRGIGRGSTRGTR